jgi:hypothetical protein
MKVHKLKTIEDITKVLTDKNIDNFLEDFRMWLSMRIEFTKLGISGDTLTFDNSQFRWIDDGKHEADLRIRVKTKL